jgi:hypothetical protein
MTRYDGETAFPGSNLDTSLREAPQRIVQPLRKIEIKVKDVAVLERDPNYHYLALFVHQLEAGRDGG